MKPAARPALVIASGDLTDYAHLRREARDGYQPPAPSDVPAVYHGAGIALSWPEDDEPSPGASHALHP